MPAATFVTDIGTATFSLLLDGAGLESNAVVNVRHIPGGDVTYVDYGGRELMAFPCRAKLTTFADLYALLLLTGQLGTLSYSETATEPVIMTVRLRKAGRSRALGNGVQLVSLDFLVSSVP